jgi:hypothetical protein
MLKILKTKPVLYYLLINFLLGLIINPYLVECHPELFTNKFFDIIYFIVIKNLLILFMFYVYYHLYKINANYKTAIIISIFTPILYYHSQFLGSQIWNLFEPKNILEVNSNYEIGASLNQFFNPLEYHPFYNIFVKFYNSIISLFMTKQYIWLLVLLLTNSFTSLYFFSKVMLFKRLNINLLFSLIFPLNYIKLIDEFELNSDWKIYLFIPILNFFIMFKINRSLCEHLNINENNALGIMLLPIIYYPKITYTKNLES